MGPILLFCALILLGPTLRATPVEDFTARGKELLANKGKMNDAVRLHRLIDFSWEYTMKDASEFATAVGYPGQNDRWSDISFEAIARRKETNKLDLELIKSIDRTKLPESDLISYDLYRRNAEFSVEGDQFPFDLLQINHMGGVQQNVAQVISSTTFKTTAEKELGQKFDLRGFHDEILKHGALPMSVLETHLKEWVAKAKKA